MEGYKPISFDDAEELTPTFQPHPPSAAPPRPHGIPTYPNPMQQLASLPPQQKMYSLNILYILLYLIYSDIYIYIYSIKCAYCSTMLKYLEGKSYLVKCPKCNKCTACKELGVMQCGVCRKLLYYPRESTHIYIYI